MSGFLRRLLLIAVVYLCCLGSSALGQSFQLASTQLDIAIAKDFNHTDYNIPITSTAQGFNIVTLSVQSNANWVTPSIDTTNRTIKLAFQTAALNSGSYNAAITISSGVTQYVFSVKASVSQLNIVKLVDDPKRSRTYGLSQNGVNAGCIVAIAPLQNTPIGCVTVGKKPVDLAVSKDGTELVVLNSADKSLCFLNPVTFSVNETSSLPAYDNWDVTVTSGHVAFGPGSTIYYTDGAWAPTLRVYNRATKTNTQSILVDGYGIGAFAISPDNHSLIGWIQYGWSAGWGGSYIARYSVDNTGRLSFIEKSNSAYPTVLDRDPLDTPVLFSNDSTRVFVKQLAVDPLSVGAIQKAFSNPIYAISPNAEIASTDTSIYEVGTGLLLATLPVTSPVQVITNDYARLVYYDPTNRVLRTLNLSETVGLSVLKQSISPSAESLVPAPEQLVWPAQPGIDRYHLYFGTSQSAVLNATPSSPSIIGEINATSYKLTQSLTPGTQYFWRVDAIGESGVVKGSVYNFTVSPLLLSKTTIDTATVAGHTTHRVDIQLSGSAGLSWQASTSVPWLSFARATGNPPWLSLAQPTGKTPATLSLIFNAALAQSGVNTTSVTITPEGQPAISIPVTFRVDPLAVTVMESDRTSNLVYAISEAPAETSGGPTRAYLLEIDSVSTKINRVLRVGSSATDLAIHYGDDRIYVTNWATGALLAINRSTFTQVQSYPFSPFGGGGSGSNDVYRISAGKAGRIIVEEEDQWIDVSMFDTTTGTKLKSQSERQGGGKFSPDGRYYYHGDNNISNAELHRFDTNGDTFTKLAHVRVATADSYGSRIVVVSQNGNRVFWNGGAFQEDLTPEWNIGSHIYSTSPDGRYAFGENFVYDLNTKFLFAPMPVATKVSAYNAFSNRLLVQSGQELKFYRINGSTLTQEVGAPIPQALSPTSGATVQAPEQLSWAAQLGASRFHLYFGTSESAVASATSGSQLDLGEVVGTSFKLNSPLIPGTRYFWRVDAIGENGVSKGSVYNFTVSLLSLSQKSIDTSTVAGHTTHQVDIQLSGSVGLSWQASSAAPWISFVQATGKTPATLSLILNAALAQSGVNTSSVTITPQGKPAFSIPVTLRVDPLAVTVMESDRTSNLVYAISEAPAASSGASTRAYLLEIDSVSTKINRVLRVGSSATDLTIHHGDDRIYVTNWSTGALLAINRSTFTQVQSYLFTPFGGGGYGRNDVYRISAGKAGRIIVEEEDQWINLSIFDTTNGTKLKSQFEREGGGKFSPDGRYYYHGDNNSSGAELHRFDTNDDTFTKLAHVRVATADSYGSRIVVVSQNGNRVFWNGGAFQKDLTLEWNIGSHIYSTSADGRYAFGENSIYDLNTKALLAPMPVVTKVSAYNAFSNRLLVQSGQELKFYRINGSTLTQEVGAPIPQALDPISGSTVQAPEQLSWTAQPGVSRFHLYFGTAESGVRAATPGSLFDLGEVVGTSFKLNSPLLPGARYFWRVDAIGTSGVSKGSVYNFTVSPVSLSQKSIDTATVFGHTTHQVDIQLSGSAGLSWQASSAAPWISFVQATGKTPSTLSVIFNATLAQSGVNTSSVTITLQGKPAFSIPVTFRVDPLAVTVMESDRTSNLVYAISEAPAASSAGPTRAYLLEIDSVSTKVNRVLRVGSSATDLAIHHGDDRIYVTNWSTGALLAINRSTFTQVQSYPFSPFGGVGSASKDVYRISAGKTGRLIVEGEDQWVDLSIFDTTNGTKLKNQSEREGGGKFSPDGRYYYHGDNNSSGAELHRFDTNGDTFTKLAHVRAATANYYGSRIVVVSQKGNRVFWNGGAFQEDLTLEWNIGSHIYSTTPDGRYAFGENSVYDLNTKSLFAPMPVTTKVSAYNAFSNRLLVQSGQELKFYRINGSALTQEVGAPIPQALDPISGASVQAPEQLSWTAQPGVSRFHLYFGTSESAVASASSGSQLDFGEVIGTSFKLNSPLIPGTRYFWRIDAIGENGVSKGNVYNFTVAPVSLSQNSIDTATVAGHTTHQVDIQLSGSAGLSWQASSAAPWISFVQATGKTPSTLSVIFNAVKAGTGSHTASVTITPQGQPSFSIPVTFQVDPLAVTVMESDRTSNLVYAISEAPAASSGASTRAYLLEIDSLSMKINRVLRVGSSATDLAIHYGDKRIYVTNWVTGALLAINRNTFTQVQSYPFSPFGGVGSGGNDVYRISAGKAGRLIVEEEDQWINLSIFDTTNGTKLKSQFEREGGGKFSPDGRYYYHGDNDSSGAELHRFDTTGDTFTELAHVRVDTADYYGSRVVVVSQNGNRVFWNGGVFQKDLTLEWNIGSHIYSTSPDGRYAFGRSAIFDVSTKTRVADMPVTTTVSSYNSSSQRLVIQNGSALSFYRVIDGALVLDSVPVFDQMPDDITVEASSALGNVVDFTIPSANDPSGIVSVKADIASGTRFAVGTTTVHITATNAKNRTATVSFKVNVQDTIAPVFSGTIATTQISSVNDAWVTLPDYTAQVTATDSVGVVSLTQDPKAGTHVPSGTTQVTLTAVDAARNKTTKSFDIEVLALPSITPPPTGIKVMQGTTKNLSVEVQSHGTVHYQWKKEGKVIPGATSATLSLQKLQANQLGNYTVVVSNDIGSLESGPFSLSFIDLSPVAGNYQGALSSEGRTSKGEAVLPGRLTMNITGKGSLSAKLDYQGQTYALSGQLSSEMTYERTIVRKGQSNLQLNLQVDTATATVKAQVKETDSQHQSESEMGLLTAYSPKNAAPQTGRYTMGFGETITVGNGPTASGVMAISVAPNGVVTLTGWLSDKSAVTCSALIQNDGTLAYYNQLYSAAYPYSGYLSGAIQLSAAAKTAAISGHLEWRKPAQPAPTLWRDGFVQYLTVEGSTYKAPAANKRVLEDSTGQLNFRFTDLDSTSVPVSLTSANRFIPLNAKSSLQTLTLDKITGLVSGTCLDGLGKKRQCWGIVRQTQNEISGFYVRDSDVGEWTLTP